MGLEEIPSLPNTHLPRCWAPSGQKSGRAPLTRVARAHAGEAQGHGVRGAVATGSGTGCSPHSPRRRNEGLRLSPWGGGSSCEGTSSRHLPPRAGNGTGAAGARGPRSERRREAGGGGWGGALHILLRSLAFTPGAVGTGKGCWQENDGVGFAFQKVEGWLAAGRAAQWPKGW